MMQAVVFDVKGAEIGRKPLTIAESAKLLGYDIAKPPEAEDRVGPRPVWHVVLPEPNREATTHERLRSAGFAPYVGLFKKSIRQNFFRRREVTVPIFPGYVFLHIDPATFDEHYAEIKATRGVRAVMMLYAEEPVIIPNAAIALLKATEMRLAGQKPILPFKVGDMVEVEIDEWTTMLAVVEDLEDVDRIKLGGEFMGRFARMTAPANRLKPVA